MKIPAYVIILLSSVIMCAVMYTSTHHSFKKIGDCAFFDYNQESWESPPPVWQIVEFGNTNVRVKFYNEGHWYDNPGTLSIWVANFMTKVECPK